ncbi:MAG: DUF962 domain-containing protein, partial [Saprospiraceae bacterium]|nr:DUF962 domain-containing protein [Saprospiraceae bacterium]
MKKLDLLLSQYGESHENAINKLIHWFCVPLIFISLYGMLRLVVFNSDYPQILNLGTVILIAALIYYIRLSVPMFFGFVVWSGFVWWLNETLLNNLGSTNFIKLIIGIFVSAWIVQFIGHKI